MPEPVKVDVELAFAKPVVETVYGKLPIAPTLKNKWRVEPAWTSSNTGVATVDQEGKLTVTGIGETTITATYAGDDTYNAGEATYMLKVAKGEAVLQFANSLFTCVKGSEPSAWPVVETQPEGLTVSYSSDNTGVATVNAATGAVTMVGTGNAQIKATFVGNDYYNAAEAAYTLSVAKPEAKQPQLDFGKVQKLSVTKGQTFTQPVIANPQALALTWTTDDADVATVDELGNLTIKDLGTTTVTATWAGNDEWKAASASYLLEVRIVETIVEETAVNFADDSAIGGSAAEPKLDNTTVGSLLFTLDSTQGDGYDKEDASISIQSTLTADQVDAIISTTEPGSAAFAEAFAGMSFLLNAGKGSVDVDFFTIGDRQLNVKLGDKAAATFTKNERGSITVDYDVTEDTWAYVYASMKPATAGSRAMFRTSASEPEQGKLKIYGFNIKPTEVIASGITALGSSVDEPLSNSALVGTAAGALYNLQGVPVSKPAQPGLYIMQGSKVVVK